MRFLPVVALLLVTEAHADDAYLDQSFGLGMGRGQLADSVGNTIQSRLALGARVKWLAVEGWVMSNVVVDRDGESLGFVGGEPAAGRADLEAYGFALVGTALLDRNISGFVRAGPSLVSGTGVLADYRGQGFGASVGMAISGDVRALGLLWAPLLFVKRGPKVNAALFVDVGCDVYRLADGMDTIHGRVDHITIGFSVGR